MDHQNHILQESGRLLTEKEVLETDDIFLKMNGEISAILGDSNRASQRLREAYLSAMEMLEEKDAALREKEEELTKEREAKENLLGNLNLLQQKYRDLEGKKKQLSDTQASIAQERDNLQEQIKVMDGKLSDKEKEYQRLTETFNQTVKNHEKSYSDMSIQKDSAESGFKQCRQDLEKERETVKELQIQLGNEKDSKKSKESEAENWKKQFSEKSKEAETLNNKVSQYESKEEKMPALMKLYEAYDSVMKQRNELPPKFVERLQSIVPLDDFDSFLTGVLKRIFPISYYQSIQAFINVCVRSGDVSREDMKKALRISDDLLSEVFDFGKKYFEEEKLARMDVKEGNQFNNESCIYIDEKGKKYGNIAAVWLQGLKDEKNNKIYRSYVEGE